MESGGLLEQLGIDWKLFLSQAINFFILLLILRAFVYKPLLSMIKERNKKIKEGLEKAAEAEVRLNKVDIVAKEHLKKADARALVILKETEQRGRAMEQSMRQKVEEEQRALMAQAKLSYERTQQETKEKVLKEASALVKKVIATTVEMKPEMIDEALIEKAVKKVKEA